MRRRTLPARSLEAHLLIRNCRKKRCRQRPSCQPGRSRQVAIHVPGEKRLLATRTPLLQPDMAIGRLTNLWGRRPRLMPLFPLSNTCIDCGAVPLDPRPTPCLCCRKALIRVAVRVRAASVADGPPQAESKRCLCTLEEPTAVCWTLWDGSATWPALDQVGDHSNEEFGEFTIGGQRTLWRRGRLQLPSGKRIRYPAWDQYVNGRMSTRTKEQLERLVF